MAKILVCIHIYIKFCEKKITTTDVSRINMDMCSLGPVLIDETRFLLQVR